MPSFIRLTSKIAMEGFLSWGPCSECFLSSRRCSPTADIKDRNLPKRLQMFCRISTLKSSNVPIGSADLWSCPSAGSSSAPSPGSIAADGSPRIGRTSIARRSRSCASPQSASCSENSTTQPELSGQTLRAAGYFATDQMPELYAGTQRHGSNFPVQYLGANVPQGWAAGSIFSILQALLGFQADAPNGLLYLDPALPAWMPDLIVRDLRVGSNSFDIRFALKDGETTFDVIQGDAKAALLRPM